MSGWAAPWFFFGSATAPPLVDVLMSAVAAAMLCWMVEMSPRSGPGQVELELKLLSPARPLPLPLLPLEVRHQFGWGEGRSSRGRSSTIYSREAARPFVWASHSAVAEELRRKRTSLRGGDRLSCAGTDQAADDC